MPGVRFNFIVSLQEPQSIQPIFTTFHAGKDCLFSPMCAPTLVEKDIHRDHY